MSSQAVPQVVDARLRNIVLTVIHIGGRQAGGHGQGLVPERHALHTAIYPRLEDRWHVSRRRPTHEEMSAHVQHAPFPRGHGLCRPSIHHEDSVSAAQCHVHKVPASIIHTSGAPQ